MSLSGFSIKRGLFVPAAGGSVLLDSAWALNSFTSGVLVTTSVTFNPDGSITTVTNDTSTQPAADNWWTDNPETAVGDDYEVAFTAATGTFSTGLAINTYGRLDVARTWTVRVLAKNSPDVKACNGVTFAIRPNGGGSVIDSIAGCAHSASN